MSWPAAPTDYVPPGYRADDPLVIAAGVGSAKKDGRWTVPPHLLLEGGMGSIRLDCRLAQAAGPVVNLDVIGSLGSILIILPPGWGATMDRLVPGLGGQSATSKVDSQPDEGQPLLVFSGRLGLGSLVVRHPSRWERWRLRRRLAREASRQLGAAGQL
jgi:hypothetical protein